MARKSRKNTPIAVAEPTDNLTTKAVLSLDKEAKPYQVGIYARLSFESEANKERDTVDTQIAYIREFINGQDDMVEVCVYADISVTGTTFERPEFDRMIHDIRAGKINTVITRDLSRLGRNYVEAGNYIERVFPFLDVRYIAITDDFDTARPGTDLSVPFKNIVNEYYSKDLSKKVETGKHSIWAQGGFSEGTPPYGYYRATDGSRKLLIDEEVSDNVVRIFNMFLDGKGYAGIAKTLQYEGILSPPKYRFYKSGKIELAEKAREWHYSHVKEILQGEYYIGNIVHGKQRKALDTGRKNVKTDASTWQRIENVHEPIIDKDTFYKTRERMEHIKKKHLEASKPKADVPNKPDNILVYKTKCACCGGSVLIGRHHTYSEKFYYKCKNRRKLARLCENKYSYDYSEVMDSVFSVIRQHMSLCVEKTKFVQKMNSRRDIGEHMWSASTVMEILYNEVYIGSVINNKTADNIDTGHQVVQRDKEDWIIVENCHEPLVSVEDFKLAHKMIARREVTKRKPNGKWRKSYIRCGICGKGLYKYGNKSSYRCHNGHVSRIRGEELEATLLDIARNMALAQLQEFELKTDGGNCPDNLEREIESLKKSKAHYAKLKFEIYDDYTKTNITRDQMAKKTAEVKQKIAEIESLITEKQETLDMQKDLFLDAKQEQLTKLSKLDEFDEEVIRYLIDYVLVYDNEHIEIRWNFDDFQAG